MLQFIRRRPVTAHYLFSLLIASAVIVYTIVMFIVQPATAGAMGALVKDITDGPWYANIATIAIEVGRYPTLFAIFIYASAPTIAALTVAGLGGGGGLRRLLSRFKPVGPEGRPLRAVVLYVGMALVYAAGFWVYDFVAGPGVDAFGRLRAVGGSVVFGALLGLFIDEGGTLEELGWRGFEWPLLQDSFRSPLGAACLLGVLHWGWHLPREVPNLMGGVAISTWLLGQGVFVALCIALSIVAVFCMNRAGGSVWPAIFVHGGTNVWGKGAGDAAAPSFGILDLRTLLVIVIAVVIVVFARKRLGRAPVGV